MTTTPTPSSQHPPRIGPVAPAEQRIEQPIEPMVGAMTQPAVNPPVEPTDGQAGASAAATVLQGVDPGIADGSIENAANAAGVDGTGAVSVTDTRPWGGAIPEAMDAWGGLVVVVAGVAIVVFVVARMVIGLAGRRSSARPASVPIGAGHEPEGPSESPLDRAMSEAEQLVRRLAAVLDNKADRVELLVQEADRKLAELNRTIAQADRRPTHVTNGERALRPSRAVDPLLMDRARVEQDRHERTQPRDDAEPSSDSMPPDPVHRRVCALADDGMSSLEIARSLNQPVGQVELILNLRKSG